MCRLEKRLLHNKLPIGLWKICIVADVLGAPSQVCVCCLCLQAAMCLQTKASSDSATAASQTSSD
jgi:hypothetical protein